jgi:hypothetical protein
VAKPNYSFQKRQKDLAKKAKKEEKRLRKLNRANSPAEDEPELPLAEAEPNDQS